MSGGKRIGRLNETLIHAGRTEYNTEFQQIPPLASANADTLGDATTGNPALASLGPIGDTSTVNSGAAINDNFATLLAFVQNIASLLSRDKQMEIVGLNADSGTYIWSPKGGMQATTHTDINSQTILRPTPLRRAAQPWVPEEQSRYSGGLKTEDTIASLRFAFGLRTGEVSAPDTGAGNLAPGSDFNESFFYYDPAFNDGKIAVVNLVAGGTDGLVVRDTGIAPTPNTLHRFHVEFDEDRIPRFFMSINDGDEFRVAHQTVPAAVGDPPTPLANFEPGQIGAPLLPINGIETLAAAAIIHTFVGVSVGILDPGPNPVYTENVE